MVRTYRACILVLLAWGVLGCASAAFDMNQVLVGVVANDANKVRDAARAGKLLDNGIKEVDGWNGCGERALHIAIEANQIEIVRILLQEGANPDLASELGQMAGICADSPRKIAPVGYPPLQYAISLSRVQCAEELLFAGANPDNKTPDGKTALDFALAAPALTGLTAYLKSPIHLAARRGDIAALRTLAAVRTRLDSTEGPSNSTPLEEALLGRHWPAVDFILEQGVVAPSSLSSPEVKTATAEYLEDRPDSAFVAAVRQLSTRPVR